MRWPLLLICPESLETSDYAALSTDLRVERMSDKWFATNASYSALLLTRPFYERFAEYEFILIHQPDCFVFQDQLEYWCSRGWDYIAPPFFRDYTAESGAIDGVG